MKFCKIIDNTTLASKRANLLPIHSLLPAPSQYLILMIAIYLPKGIYAKIERLPFSKCLSGINSNGFSQLWLDLCNNQGQISKLVYNKTQIKKYKNILEFNKTS